MELVKAESLNFCNACLCVGRTLYPIKDEKSKQFYLQALSEIPLFDMTMSPPAVCWECRLQLQRAVDFREQVKDSYRILVTYTSEAEAGSVAAGLRVTELRARGAGTGSSSAREIQLLLLRRPGGIAGVGRESVLAAKENPLWKNTRYVVSGACIASHEKATKTPNMNLNESLLSDVSRPPRLKITHNDAINIEPIYTYELCDHCDVKNSPETHYDQGSKDSSIDVNRIQCTQRVFVKEEQCVKPELDGVDIDTVYSDGQESDSVPIDNLSGIDNEIKTLINEIDKKRSKKVKRSKRKSDKDTKTGCKYMAESLIDKSSDGVFLKDEIKVETHAIDVDNEEGIDNDIKSIMCGIDKKRSLKKLKRSKRDVEKVRGSKKRVKKFKDVNGVPEILTIELSYDEMTEERIKEYSKESYINAEYKCETCILGFNYHKSYKTHVTAKHSPDIGDYTCPICKTVLVSVDSFTAHYKRHMRRYECSLCKKRTLDMKVMEQHYYTSHAISLKNYKCNECGKISKSIDSHRYHTDTHKSRLQCSECDKTFRHRGGLLNHRLTVHELRNDFPCNVCNKVFRWKNSLKRHLDSHDAKNKLAPSAAFCALCNISFASLSSYQRHMTNSLKHVTKDAFRFICDHCHRRFANKTKLRDHIEEKHLHKTYQCDICLKVSKNRVNLDQHIRNVHKGRPNNKMCHHCGKGFPTKVQLESHIRTHTGERPFICEYCPTTFSQQSNLYKHNRQVHLNMKSKRYPLTKKRKEDIMPVENVPIEYNPIEIEFHL